jgi:hypothetical protein
VTYQVVGQPRRKPGPSLAVALAVVGIGIAVIVTGVIPGLLSVVHDARSFDAGVAPVRESVELPAGHWEIFAPVPARAVSIDAVTVSAADGAGILVQQSDTTGIDHNHDGLAYHGQLVFTTPRAGDYDLNINVQGPMPFLLARTYGSSFTRAGGWFALAAGGILVVVIGVIMVIVGGVRRHRFNEPLIFHGSQWQPVVMLRQSDGSRQPAPRSPPPTPPSAGTGVPPGWYPDPTYASNGRRWWDGTMWTDDTQA